MDVQIYHLKQVKF